MKEKSKEQGFLIVSIDGTSLSGEDFVLLQNPKVAGILLFGRNFDCSQQLCKLTDLIRVIRPDRDKFCIMVDHEGGLVQRFKKDGFDHLPPAKYYGRLYDHSPDLAMRVARWNGFLMATQLRAHGVDISLAPVADLDRGNQAISPYGRAFHRDPEITFLLANAFILGMHSAGMPSILKHFPGHGTSHGDSHHVRLIDRRSWESLLDDLSVFKRLLPVADAIMPAHITFSLLDPINTVLYFPFWMKTILRGFFRFSGVVVSDCLSMVGAGEANRNEKIIAAMRFSDLVIYSGSSAETYNRFLSNMTYRSTQAASVRIRRFFSGVCKNTQSKAFQVLVEDVMGASMRLQYVEYHLSLFRLDQKSECRDKESPQRSIGLIG